MSMPRLSLLGAETATRGLYRVGCGQEASSVGQLYWVAVATSRLSCPASSFVYVVHAYFIQDPCRSCICNLLLD